MFFKKKNFILCVIVLSTFILHLVCEIKKDEDTKNKRHKDRKTDSFEINFYTLKHGHPHAYF
jgi:hypothetical protein